MTALFKVLGVLAGVAVIVVCGLWAFFAWLGHQIDKPPALTAAYASDEALLAMEALAGDLIAAVPAEKAAFPFDVRVWSTDTCRSGWDDSIGWDGFVSASVSYEFSRGERGDAGRIAYGEQVTAALEEAGLDPEVEESDDGEYHVSAERDDGLTIWYDSMSGLYVQTGCVVEAEERVYAPPHGPISPAGDRIDLER